MQSALPKWWVILDSSSRHWDCSSQTGSGQDSGDCHLATPVRPSRPARRCWSPARVRCSVAPRLSGENLASGDRLPQPAASACFRPIRPPSACRFQTAFVLLIARINRALGDRNWINLLWNCGRRISEKRKSSVH